MEEVSQTDPRADLYALGITMNQMLTGEHPSLKQATGRLGHIISRCIQVNPHKRYKDVAGLMEALVL